MHAIDTLVWESYVARKNTVKISLKHRITIWTIRNEIGFTAAGFDEPSLTEDASVKDWA